MAPATARKGYRMVSETSGTDNRAALLEAFRAVRDVFASFGDPAIGGLNLYQAEDRVGRELFTLFDSCQSMAMDMITARVFGPFADYAGGVDGDFRRRTSPLRLQEGGNRAAGDSRGRPGPVREESVAVRRRRVLLAAGNR